MTQNSIYQMSTAALKLSRNVHIFCVCWW